jgi:hypothetical protein
MASLDDQIDALYQLPLNEFTAARTAAARERTGPQAETVRRLKKPSLVAWAVNQLYWREPSVYQRLLTRGQALRAAQLAALKGRAADIRQATEAHRQAVSEATRHAVQIAVNTGFKPNPEHLMRMLEAVSLAAAPPGRPGRFTEALQPAAFEALAGITPAKRARPVTPPADEEASKATAAARRAERKREQEAQAERKRADAEFAAATRALTHAQAAEARAKDTLAHAETQLREAEAAMSAARRRRDAVRSG